MQRNIETRRLLILAMAGMVVLGAWVHTGLHKGLSRTNLVGYSYFQKRSILMSGRWLKFDSHSQLIARAEGGHTGWDSR